MKEFVFFGMIIIPVYMFSALLDAFIFNSIQFWSGDNPIKSSELENDGLTKVVRFGDVTVRWTPTSEGTAVTYERYGVIERRATIVSSAAGYRLVDEGGATRRSRIYCSMAPSLSSIVIVRSCGGGRAISYDRLSRAMAQSWTSLKHPHVGCRCINLVRRWMTGRSCRQESTGLEKSCCTAARLGYTRTRYRVIYIVPWYSPSQYGGHMKKLVHARSGRSVCGHARRICIGSW